MKTITLILALLLCSCATYPTYRGEWKEAQGKTHEQMYNDSLKCTRDANMALDQRGYFLSCMKVEGHQLNWIEEK